MPDATLHLEPCDHATAKAAVLRWHYSRRLPAVVTRAYAVREDGAFVGVVVFGPGCRHLGRPYDCDHSEACELIRVALGPHRTPTSRVVAVALKLLRRDLPALRLVVSFADTREGHHGGIYQAGGWTYAGDSIQKNILVNGVEVHPRGLWNLHGKGGQSIPWLRAHVDPEARLIPLPPKHRYLMPLDEEMRGRIRPLARPYPKRAASIDGDAPISQMGQGGSIPTAALSPRREATHAA